MAENKGGGATPFLAFLIGGLIVLVAVIGFAFYGGGMPAPAGHMNVNVHVPKLPTPTAPGAIPAPITRPNV